MSTHRAVSYLRVSTARQGASGLGLEAQRAAVATHIAAGRHTLIAEYVEVESGRRSNRPQLAAALAAAKLHRATLVIAKLDRLARSVATISALMEAGTPFECVDLPYANRLTIHLMAAMAEHEAVAIFERTKAALAAAKARGVRLGNPNGAQHLRAGAKAASALGAIARQERAMAHATAVRPLLEQIGVTAGGASIARELNRQGVPSPNGGVWYAEQVRRTLRVLNSAPLGNV